MIYLKLLLGGENPPHLLLIHVVLFLLKNDSLLIPLLSH